MIDKKIKLLIVYPASDFGGAAQYVLSILRKLPRERFEIHVAVYGKGPLFQLLSKEQFSAFDLKVDYTIFTLLPNVVSVRQFLRSGNYDVIHAHTAKGGFIICLAAKGLPARIVYTGHVTGLARTKMFPLNLVYHAIERFIYSSSDCVTVLSRAEYDFGLSTGSLHSRLTSVVAMSIDVNRFSTLDDEHRKALKAATGIPANSLVVGMIGRLTYQKDPELFVKVAAQLNSRADNVYFLWVGEGDMREEAVQMAASCGLSGKFIVTGQQHSDKIPQFLSIIDVVLFTSRFEGLPIALLEAMAAKKLIVAANVGSVHEIIKDEVTGWLFEAGDYTKAAMIVSSILMDNQRFNGIRQAAFDLVVRDHSPEERIANEFQSIYEKVLK